MKFECKGDVFIKAIQQVSRARSKNQKDTYLKDIHITLENNLLTLRATNLELFCEKSIPVKGMVNGSCLLQGDTLLKIISIFQTNNTTLSCEVDESLFTITTDKGIIEIKTTPYEDFPTLPKQGNLIGTLPKETVVSLIKEGSFCAATTEIKPEIASLFLYTKNDFVYAVSTDSYRLVEKKIPNTNNVDFSVLIPQKHIGDIIQILQEETEDLTFSIYESIFSITSPTTTLSIHTITGHFPDYQQLFPKEFTTTVTISKEDLQKALTLTTYFNEQYSQVSCTFTKNKGTFHSKNESVGQVTHTIDLIQEGDDIEARYNNRYFLEALPYIQGTSVVCTFTTPQKPVFLQGTQDAQFTYLLMPLNR